MKASRFLILFSWIFFASCSGPQKTPIAVHPDNWHYFTDHSGKTVFLTGSHTWMRKSENKRWNPDGWDLDKFNKYLDFLQYWNHNYIRLWMWEHSGDADIWEKDADGLYDLSKLNQAYFDLVKSFVAAARDRGIFTGVMLFQGWSGCCEASAADWPYHPMNRENNINGIDGDPDEILYGVQVHSLLNPRIVDYQEAYVKKMIDELNGFENLVWEIGNETIESSIPWKKHMVNFIREYEKGKKSQHLILDGTGNGVGNESVFITDPDIFCPCAIKGWASREEPFIINPPVPDEKAGKPMILDNDHIGNHFLRFSALDQRNWSWKAFTRGYNIAHMDCYDIRWDREDATFDHPIPGVNTNPHYDPQRKSMGDVLRYANRIGLVNMLPATDSLICSTTYCLSNTGIEYLAYQPDTIGSISLELPAANYSIETFDAIDNSVGNSSLEWEGGLTTFPKPAHVAEDWVVYVKKMQG